MYSIITFENTYSAMALEKVLKNNNIDITIIPTPTSITKSCGIAIRFKSETVKEIVKIIGREKLNFENIYEKRESSYVKLF